MGQNKGGKKLRRCGAKAQQYAAQFARTERNKLNARLRIARRKEEMPKPEGGQP